MIEIEKIKDPSFLKDMDINDLNELSIDIRKFILEKVSKNGGHLSSNLGVVELTIALCKVFDAKSDYFLFDVGHQAYTYKILTGRANEFDTMRKLGGISGFLSMKESKFDKFETGHSSTSISTGVGIALGNSLNNKKNNVISIIGDGAISSGLAYEALNHLGTLDTKQIIILNDNQMSISQNVGALHNLLDEIRSTRKYKEAKDDTKKFLGKTKFGKKIRSFIGTFKDWIKKLYLHKASIFDDFGIDYFGPINGHDFNELIKYLNIAKKSSKTVILHVITTKGKGYIKAEEDKVGIYHSIAPFDIETGELLKKDNLPSYSEIVSSYVYNYAKKDKDIVCITPGMMLGSRLDLINEKIPDRVFDTGINEEHATLFANGLALSGKKPFVFIYSTFMQRAYDEIIHDVARVNSNVTFIIDRSGFVPGDGASHQGLYDIPMLMMIPNMVISMPKDANEANNLIATSLNYNGPFAIRIPKANIKYDFPEGKPLKIGSWEVLKEGIDAYIISYGRFINNSLEICELLEKLGIKVGLINARFLKPIDVELLSKLDSLNKPIIVYEESTKIGSLGSVVSMHAKNVSVIAAEDKFFTHASYDDLLKDAALDVKSVSKEIIRILGK